MVVAGCRSVSPCVVVGALTACAGQSFRGMCVCLCVPSAATFAHGPCMLWWVCVLPGFGCGLKSNPRSKTGITLNPQVLGGSLFVSSCWLCVMSGHELSQGEASVEE